MKRKGVGSEATLSAAKAGNVDSALLTPLEQQRQSFKQRKKTLGNRETSALAIMQQFQQKIRAKAAAGVSSDAASDRGLEEGFKGRGGGGGEGGQGGLRVVSFFHFEIL
eukprot:TRINITY_DN61_c0_g1_i1.p1 TRINITY_DN61_c0_g1~~TRINITY_DN61_c0_g1_i1.p1  ORF type:complete len:109 (-),score=29.53 TRINITY_DN61_c0_g1_i1:157-483(-)